MKYIVLTDGQNYRKIQATTSNKKMVPQLEKVGYSALSIANSKEDAEQMIMALKVNKAVEKYAGHLPDLAKVEFKSEICEIASVMYNEIVNSK